MDYEQLKEKKAHEADKAARIAKSASSNNKKTIRDFYPELKLEGTYGHYIFERPVYTLIPYLDNILIDLPPYKNRQMLEEKLGVDFDTLIELVSRKRVSITLDSDPLDYKNLDYLDPILEYAPSAEIRNAGYLSVLSGSLDDFLEESKKLFSGNLGEYSKRIGWNHYVKGSENEIEHTGINILAQIGALGYYDTYQKILEKGKTDPATAYTWAYFYSGFLADPVFCSLDGITPLDKMNVERKMKSFGNEAKDIQINNGKFFNFPSDVGRAILDKFEIYLPNNIDIALEMDTSVLRKLLAEIDSRLEQNKDIKFEDRKIQVEEAVNEAAQSYDSLNSITQKLESPKVKKVAEITLGVTGLAAMVLTNQQLLFDAVSFGISAGILTVPQLLLERVMRFRKPSHMVAMMDLRKKVLKAKVSRR